MANSLSENNNKTNIRKFQFISYLLRIRSSFWLLPFVMIAIAIVLAFAMVLVDKARYVPDSIMFNWIANIGPGGARAVFSTIAGSTITVAGVIFSIAMVVLTMASSQFGPRLIPTFMRVGKIQFGIGLFVGSFVYCLIMLTFVPSINDGQLLPIWGVVVGMVLGIIAFMVLIMLIHEIATFIQAPNVADRVARDIQHTFARVFPEGAASDDRQENEGILHDWQQKFSDAKIVSAESGYIRTIDYPGLTRCVTERDLRLHITVKPGRYLIRGEEIARVFGTGQADEELSAHVMRCFQVGSDRDLAQDAEYAIDQMNEIALRALSPGINDPFTAINCIDKLCSALGYLSRRHLADPLWQDADGVPRLLTTPDTYQSIVDSAFDQIRHFSAGHPAVIIRLLDSMGRLAMLDLAGEFRTALIDQLDKIDSASARKMDFESDQRDFEQRLEKAKTLLKGEGAVPPSNPSS